MRGDGSSGDGNGSGAVYVGGNATLIYDNANSDVSPAIEGTYGCEMRGNVTLDVRSGRVNEICGHFGDPAPIKGNIHIIAGSSTYENTDKTLRLNGNWSITGAGQMIPDGVYEVDGDVVIDAYENVWGWDKVDRYPMMSHILKVRRKRTLVDLLPLMSTAPMLALFMEQSGVP